MGEAGRASLWIMDGKSIRVLGVGAMAIVLALCVWIVTSRRCAFDSLVEPASRIVQREAPTRDGDGGAIPAMPTSRARATAAGVEKSLATERGWPQISVRIVNSDTLEPIAAARVWVWPAPTRAEADALLETWLRASTLEAHAGEAQEYLSDEHGLVIVPCPADAVALTAISENRWGRAAIDSSQTEGTVVALAVDKEIRVRVVDAGGAPVENAPVALRQRGLSAPTDHLTARTAADGMALLRHAGPWLNGSRGGDAGLCVAVQGLFDPPPERTLDDEALASEFIELVLERGGTCVVQVVTRAGSPLQVPFEAVLSFTEAAGQAAPVQLSSRTASEVTFEHVELGRELNVVVAREGTRETATARGTGPRTPGERVTLRVEVPTSALRLAGRLVDAEGTPQAALSVGAEFVTVQPEGRASVESELLTGPDGRFVLELQHLSLSAYRFELALHRASSILLPPTVARRSWPANIESGTHELGDFTLVEVPIVVAGVVVDLEDRPVSGARITAFRRPPNVSDIDDPDPSKTDLAPTRSDAQGRFELRAEAAHGLIEIRARSESLVSPAVISRSGELALRMVLGPASGMSGVVLLDPSLHQTSMLARALREDAENQLARACPVDPVQLARDGRFVLPDLCPGRYSVRILHAASGLELGRVDGVTVRAAETTRDPRLDPLDLRTALRSIEFEVVDGRGVPVREGVCYIRPSDAVNERWTTARVESGRASILYRGAALDVIVSASGFLRTQLERVTEARRVTLAPAASVRLELTGVVPMPEVMLRLGARLTPLDAATLPGISDAVTALFDEHGVLVTESEVVGALRLELFLTTRDPRAPRTEYLRTSSPSLLRVEAQATEQVFGVECSAADFEAARSAILDEH